MPFSSTSPECSFSVAQVKRNGNYSAFVTDTQIHKTLHSKESQ